MAKEDQQHCVFCKILDGVYPISSVYSDDACVGLLSTEPVNAGHVMVIPRTHCPYVADLPSDAAGHIFMIAQKLAGAIRASGIPCDGVNMFVADGEFANQEIFHFHLHVYPRVKNDGFGFKFDDRHFRQAPRQELDRIASLIRSQLPDALPHKSTVVIRSR